MKINSVKTKLLLLVLMIVSISFIFLISYNTNKVYNVQNAIIKNNTLKLSKHTSDYIDLFFKNKISLLNNISKTLPNTSDAVQKAIDETNLHKDFTSKDPKSKFISTSTYLNEQFINVMNNAKKVSGLSSLYLGYNKEGLFISSSTKIYLPPKDSYDARKRPWYIAAIQSKKAGITKPYIDSTSKKFVVSVYAPIMLDGNPIGVIASDIELTQMVNAILNIKMEHKGFAYLVDEKGKVLIHKDSKLIKKEHKLFIQVKNKKDNNFGIALDGKKEKIIAYSKLRSANWYLTLEIDKKLAYERIINDIYKEIVINLILLLTIMFIIYFALKKTLLPLKTLEKGFYNFFSYLKGEEKNISKLNINTNDEFGNMAKVIDIEMKIISEKLEEDKKLIADVTSIANKIKDGHIGTLITQEVSNPSLNELKIILNEMIATLSTNINKDINVILRSLEDYSKFDFTKSIDNPNGNIAIGLNNLCNTINKMLNENKHNGLNLNTNSEDLLVNVKLLNTSTNEIASALKETSTSLSGLTKNMSDTTQNISLMVGYSNDLSNAISSGQELASTTVKAMDSINSQTESIAEAIKVIDQISFQTNILSLNAAVEAATAGEAGKGFAVVAQEVRNLASRSADAAQEIKQLVENATSKTTHGKINADKMIEGYEKLNKFITKSNEAINDISKSSQEQQSNISMINNSIQELDSNTQKNASIASKTNQIAIDASGIAKEILVNVNEKKFNETI